MKKLLFALVLIAGGTTALVYYVYYHTGDAAPEVRREHVDRVDIVQKVSATGRLVPLDLAYVGTEIAAAKVSRVSSGYEVFGIRVLEPAEKGRFVRKGQVLVELDDTQVRPKYVQAKAALAAAEGAKEHAEQSAKAAARGIEFAEKQHAYADSELARIKKLAEALGPSYKENDINAGKTKVDAAKLGIALAQLKEKEAQAAIRAADLKIEEARAALVTAEQALKAMTITAPIDGVILERKVEAGLIITPQTSPVLFVIVPSIDRLQIIAQVGETDIKKVIGQEGKMEARFTVDAFTDEGITFKGRVTQVGQTPVTIPQRAALPGAGQTIDLAGLGGFGPVSYAVTIEIEPSERGSSYPLRPGMTANVDLIVREKAKALSVPNAALGFRPEPMDAEDSRRIADREPQGWKPVWVHTGSKPRLVFVRTGISDGTRTEITAVDGTLEPGQEVITEIVMPPKRGIFEQDRGFRP